MTDTSENEGALQKRSPKQYLRYAKWGLMGIGGLWVAEVAIGLVLNPLVLVGVAGVGAAGWYVKKGRGDGGSSAEATPAASPAQDADAVLRAEAEAAAEAELAGVSAPVSVPAAPSLPAEPAAETPLDEFERRLAELEALKARMDEN